MTNDERIEAFRDAHPVSWDLFHCDIEHVSMMSALNFYFSIAMGFYWWLWRDRPCWKAWLAALCLIAVGRLLLSLYVRLGIWIISSLIQRDERLRCAIEIRRDLDQDVFDQVQRERVPGSTPTLFD